MNKIKLMKLLNLKMLTKMLLRIYKLRRELISYRKLGKMTEEFEPIFLGENIWIRI